MPKATCRCGQSLSFPADGPERIICPKCSARIKVRRPTVPAAGSADGEGDGFIRFFCPCGRRLKVRASAATPAAGKCPDCGRVVPVPSLSEQDAAAARPVDPEMPTTDISPEDSAALERWTAAHLARRAAAAIAADPLPEAAGRGVAVAEEQPAAVVASPGPVRAEVGLRVCPRCGRPVHLSAETCRQCGAAVPKR